jgi:two-component system cell cycle sensor histidine kinase/response regulator CckA
MNILIVDDKEDNIYLLETLLKANGHSVQSATNGEQALERLKAGDIDMIISDILMPVMDGFQLCQHVKTDEALHHIPFIIYTATYTGPKDEEFAMKIGADRFILKPCEPEVFMESLQEVAAASKDRDIASIPEPLKQEEMLKLYSERLVRKLEQKMLELEKEVRIRQETEERLRAIFKAATNVSFVVTDLTDKEYRITEFSPGSEQIFGYTREKVIGKPVAILHRPEDIEKYNSIRASILENKEVFSCELIKLRKSGEQFPFPSLFSIYPISVVSGLI